MKLNEVNHFTLKMYETKHFESVEYSMSTKMITKLRWQDDAAFAINEGKTFDRAKLYP